MLEFRNVARSPPSTRASTWSFMRAMSGEITRVVPPRILAGS